MVPPPPTTRQAGRLRSIPKMSGDGKKVFYKSIKSNYVNDVVSISIYCFDCEKMITKHIIDTLGRMKRHISDIACISEDNSICVDENGSHILYQAFENTNYVIKQLYLHIDNENKAECVSIDEDRKIMNDCNIARGGYSISADGKYVAFSNIRQIYIYNVEMIRHTSPCLTVSALTVAATR